MPEAALERIVVVGASLAGARAAEGVRRAGFDGALTVVGAEPHLPYQRPPLSKDYLAGESGRDALDVRLDAATVEGVEWMLGWRAVGLSLDRRSVRVAPVDGDGGDEHQFAFDGLVIATGCTARTLPGPPVEAGLAGLHVLRTVDDADRIRADLSHRPEVVVVGAGFIGLEVASTCAKLGLNVTVIEMLPVPLARAIGPEAGALLTAMHRDHGVTIRTSTPIEALETAQGHVTGVRLGGGEVIKADVVVAGVGVSPATAWLEGSGLDVSNGVLCNASGFARGPGGAPLGYVVAAGDVARWRHPLFDADLRVEHWSHATEQGAAAGTHLVLGLDDAPEFASVPYFWSDQHGQKVSFVGTCRDGDAVHIVEHQPDERTVIVYERDGTVVGALGINAQARIMRWRQQIAARSPLTL